MGVEVSVREDKQLDLNEVEHFDCIIFSPGPGLPNETRSLFPVLEKYANSKRILGICLGMQGISEFYGGKLYNQDEVKHGVSEKICIQRAENLFLNFPHFISVGLYHSWAVDLQESKVLRPTAFSESGVLMAFEHVDLPIYAVQFHPESILTEKGKELLVNFIFPS